MSRGFVSVKFTVGFGNNLFQYVYARLLAEKNEFTLISPGIPEIEIEKTKNTKVTLGSHGEKNAVPLSIPDLKTTIISDKNGLEYFHKRLTPGHYVVSGYFEDFTFYKDNLEKIRSWFPRVEKKNKDDIILHMRLQNRLIQKGHHRNHITPSAFINGLSSFNFKKIHIITDSKKWDYYNEDDILELREKVAHGPGSHSEWVDIPRSINYMNSLIDAFSEYDPIVRCAGNTIPKSGALADNFMKDFNFIRSFDQIMIFNSTFSWWAALLSEATRVGTFGPWKATKKRKKNLGRTNFPGWFSWGSENDLYWRR